MAAAVVAGCARAPSARVDYPPERRLEAHYDQAWQAAMAVLEGRGHPIALADKAAGMIVTEWFVTNPDYRATVFATQHGDRYSDCGRPGLGTAFREKLGRIQLLLRPAGEAATGVEIWATFKTQKFSDYLVAAGGMAGEVECRSRGRLEDEVSLMVRLRLARVGLERLRR